jgi:hypothetical protein
VVVVPDPNLKRLGFFSVCSLLSLAFLSLLGTMSPLLSVLQQPEGLRLPSL